LVTETLVTESPSEEPPEIEVPAVQEPTPAPAEVPEALPTPEPAEAQVLPSVVAESSEPEIESPPPPATEIREVTPEPATDPYPVDKEIEPIISEATAVPETTAIPEATVISEPAAPVEQPVSEPEPVTSPPEIAVDETRESSEAAAVATAAAGAAAAASIEEPVTEPQQSEPTLSEERPEVVPEAPVQAPVTPQAPPPTEPIEQPIEEIEPAETLPSTVTSPPETPTPEEAVTEPPVEEIAQEVEATEPAPTSETAPPPTSLPEPPTAPTVTPAEIPAANVIPAPAAGVVGLGSYRDGTCPDCQTGEWATATSKVVGANLTGSRCDQELIDVTRSAMQGLGDSINLELAGYLGPVISATGNDAGQLVEQDLAEPIRGRLGPHLDGSSACQIVALVVPKVVRYTKTRYFAADHDGSRECAAGADCGIGSSRWATSAQVEKGHSATVVWALFENAAAGRERRATLSVYFRPPNARWKPRTIGGQ
jgi:hypothetical protein